MPPKKVAGIIDPLESGAFEKSGYDQIYVYEGLRVKGNSVKSIPNQERRSTS